MKWDLRSYLEYGMKILQEILQWFADWTCEDYAEFPGYLEASCEDKVDFHEDCPTV